MCSIKDTCAAAINGAATGATTAAEAKDMISEQLCELLGEFIVDRPIFLSEVEAICIRYGIGLVCEDGRPKSVVLQ